MASTHILLMQAYPRGMFGSRNRHIILHWVSGFAEPR